jgi:lipopolysaccharide/colanic/teichoic acid biosynthesis glycosyltransferase
MRRFLKRLLDIVIAGASLAALSPLLIIVAVGALLLTGRPIIFAQMRPGLKGRPFKLYKFRTMSIDESLPDSQRLTRFGRLLRSTSLDELPELWNVLIGDMSLVGPRPLLMEYLPLYTSTQARRHEVSPGITGWAQVNGRNRLSWEDRFALDVWYVDNWTLSLDFWILWRTAFKVLVRDGIAHQDGPTMPRFTGSDGVR